MKKILAIALVLMFIPILVFAGGYEKIDYLKVGAPLSIINGGTGNTQGSGLLNTNRFVVSSLEFVNNSGNVGPIWQGIGFGGTAGTLIASTTAPTANHPGVQTFKSAAAANSGYRFYPANGGTQYLIAGGETTEFIFYPITTTNSVVKMGFQDSATQSANVDAVNINITGTTLSGKTFAASEASTTGTTYTVSASTWYHAKIVVNSNATRVDFYLYAENGTQLWTDSLTTNIPTTAGQETGHGIVAYNTGSSAVEIIDMDFMNLYIDRNLVR